MSKWADYIRERQGKEVKEWENAFTVYSFPGDKICYIEDNYVEPKFRKKGIAAAMANEIVIEAKERGCNLLIGSVDLGAKAPADNMKVLLAYGMEPYMTEGKLIYFKKEI